MVDAEANTGKKYNKLVIIVGVILALLIIASIAIRINTANSIQSYEEKKQQLSDLGFFLFESPRLLPEVPVMGIMEAKLDDNVAKPFNQHVTGWRIVNFGYMYCPDICPINLSLLSDVKNQWVENNTLRSEANKFADVSVIHVTFDPKRDTPDLLKQYLDYMNPSFYGLSGEINNLRKLAQAFNTIFIYEKPDERGNYFITHSDSMGLVNPAGEYIGLFNGPYQKDKMIKALELLIDG